MVVNVSMGLCCVVIDMFVKCSVIVVDKYNIVNHGINIFICCG